MKQSITKLPLENNHQQTTPLKIIIRNQDNYHQHYQIQTGTVSISEGPGLKHICHFFPLHELFLAHINSTYEYLLDTSGKRLNALEVLGCQWGSKLAQNVLKQAKMVNSGPFKSPLEIRYRFQRSKMLLKYMPVLGRYPWKIFKCIKNMDNLNVGLIQGHQSQMAKSSNLFKNEKNVIFYKIAYFLTFINF